MSIRTHSITQGNVYLEDRSLLGQTKEFEVPDITWKMGAAEALGMVGSIELPDGIEAMKGKLTWNSFYPESWIRAAQYKKFVPILLMGNLEVYEQGGLVDQKGVVIRTNAFFNKMPGGAWKQSTRVEPPSEFSAYYFFMEVGGLPVLEFDVMSNVLRVGGVDQMSTLRRNLGML